jgi:hypothetical protein
VIDWYGRVAVLNKPTEDGRVLTEQLQVRQGAPVLATLLFESGPRLVGHVRSISPHRPRWRRPRPVWARLRLNVQLLAALENRGQNLYPEIDLDPDLKTIVAVTLGIRPCWPEVDAVLLITEEEQRDR